MNESVSFYWILRGYDIFLLRLSLSIDERLKRVWFDYKTLHDVYQCCLQKKKKNRNQNHIERITLLSITRTISLAFDIVSLEHLHIHGHWENRLFCALRTKPSIRHGYLWWLDRISLFVSSTRWKWKYIEKMGFLCFPNVHNYSSHKIIWFVFSVHLHVILPMFVTYIQKISSILLLFSLSISYLYIRLKFQFCDNETILPNKHFSNN